MNVRALPPSWGITVLRVVAGLIIFVTGLEKLNAGFDAFTKTTTGLGLPLAQLWGVFIPLLESIGGLMLLTGLWARWVAILFVIEYAVTSFGLKAMRAPPFGGFDSMRIDVMLWTSAIVLVLVGPGAFALESVVKRIWSRPATASTTGRAAMT